MSDVESTNEELNTFKEVGELLTLSREEMGLTLEECASKTRIRLVYLKALEEANRSVLPETVYVKSFLRVYSTFLNLDSQEILRRCAVELDESDSTKPTTVLTGACLSKISSGGKILNRLGVVAALGTAAGVFYTYCAQNDQVTLFLHSQNESEEVIAVATPQEVTTTHVTTHQEPIISSTIPTVQQDKTTVEEVAVSQPLAPVTQEKISIESVGSEPSIEEAPATPPTKEVSLVALTACWIELQDENGTVLMQRILKPGEVLKLTSSLGTITIGNAGGIRVQGGSLESSSPLGYSGQVIKRMDLAKFF